MKKDIKTSAVDDISNFKDCLHIFLIVNPVTAIVSKLFIDQYKIPNHNILILPIRNADASIITDKAFYVRENFFEKLLRKFLNISKLTKKFLNLIENSNKKFILYCSWAFNESNITPSVSQILKSELCVGHYYIEEGQLSYSLSKPYHPDGPKPIKTKYIADSNLIFRNDSLGFIGSFDDVFPLADKQKRILVNDFENLKNAYKPKLIGINVIGLTCANRRVDYDRWGEMLLSLIKKMPNGGVIKLHPSFLANKKIQKRIESIFHGISPDNISLCPNNVILEIEMLYEKKKLIGSQTSLNKYAQNFGSEFLNIKLY